VSGVVTSADPQPEEREGAAEQESRNRVLGWLRTRTPRFVRWIVLLFIASLLIPALTKQWNDRKQELQVKESLTTDISKVSANAVYGAEFSVSQQSGAEQHAARRAAVDNWLRDRAAIDPRFLVYFAHSDAADHWFAGSGQGRLGFRNAVLIYILMACCDHERSGHLKRLRAYLGAAPVPASLRDPWSVLACGAQEACQPNGRYGQAYLWLGNQVLNQRHVLLDQLLEANSVGFSSGWRDFIRDLNPLGK
jgi:hypothetical protein